MEYKCTLDSGKTVVLRDFKIKDKNVCAEAAAVRCGGNQMTFEAYMQDEVLKALIVQINDETMKRTALEDLDSVFEYGEYMGLLNQVKEIIGVGKMPKVEILNSTSGT